jgi:pimeloyl-ACP methyl ester carboxylesterase
MNANADPTRMLPRPDGAVAYRRSGDGPPLLLLHATLSSSRQLAPLAALLAPRFGVVSVDRRGSGASVRSEAEPPAPIDVAVHVKDLAALVAAEQLGPCVVVGHSYGGCLGLELAARMPDLVRAVWAYEPPYDPVAPPEAQERLAEVARRTLEAGTRSGPASAAEVFMAGVAGQAALDSLTPASRDGIRRAGRAAIADASLLGLQPDGLALIRCPVAIVTGSDSDPLYGAIAEGLRARVPGATIERVGGADHMAPVTRPDAIAASVLAFVGPGE